MDVDESALQLLDLVWPTVDVRSQGFIYAKDFPMTVSKMEDILNKGRADFERARLVSKTGEEILKKFGSDQEFFKVYKEDFKELFDGLIGTTFKSAVHSCLEEGRFEVVGRETESNSFLDSDKTPGDVDALRDEILSLKKQVAKLRRENDEKDRDVAARNEVITQLQAKDSSPVGSPRGVQKIRNLQAEVASLEQEVRFRDEVIREKDRELLKMTKQVGELKDKYHFLEREFQFYKGHAEVKGPEVIKEATKHEFIISELKRKIKEQGEQVREMRALVESKPLLNVYAELSSGSGLPEGFPFVLVLRLIMGVILTLLAISLGLKAWSVLTSLVVNGKAAPKLSLKWWEQNSLFSKLHWLFKDYFEDYNLDASRDEVLSANYNKLFGV